MLTHLAEFEHIFGPLRLFRYITFRAFAGAGTAIFLGMVFAPIIIKQLQLLKLKQVLRASGEVGKLADLHQAKQGTPTMGGLIIFLSITISTLLWADWNIYVMVSLFVYTGLTIVGFFDDYLKITKKNSKGLAGRYKLIGQALITVVSLYLLIENPMSGEHIRDLWVPFLKDPVLVGVPVLALFIFLFFVIAGSSNAINLTDGVDGLAIGCTLTVAMAYGLMAYASGNAIYADYLFLPFMVGTGELTVVCSILCGACLAFLWHNAHPAEVFMGDTGSLALGGLIGIIAFMILQPFTLVIIGGVFVIEALSVILQVGSYKMRKKRIFKMAPIHHHFELKGWAETQVVIRFWIISLVCAFAGLATLKFR